jgi:hypothetical protein
MPGSLTTPPAVDKRKPELTPVFRDAQPMGWGAGFGGCFETALVKKQYAEVVRDTGGAHSCGTVHD